MTDDCQSFAVARQFSWNEAMQKHRKHFPHRNHKNWSHAKNARFHVANVSRREPEKHSPSSAMSSISRHQRWEVRAAFNHSNVIRSALANKQLGYALEHAAVINQADSLCF